MGHPVGNPGANLKSISHRCHPTLVASVWGVIKETISLPLGCLQGGAFTRHEASALRVEVAQRPFDRPPMFRHLIDCLFFSKVTQGQILR